MKGLVKGSSIYLKKDDFIDREFVMAIGISRIQGYVPISFYLNIEKFHNISMKFKIKDNEKNKCEIHFNRLIPVWTGVPFLTDIVLIDDIDYIDITELIGNYSIEILIASYLFIDDDTDISDIKLKTVTTNISSVKSLKKGVSFSGFVKSESPKKLSMYAVDYCLCFYLLDKVPMIGRVADTRVGYFYDELYLDTLNNITGTPTALIEKLNLKKAPWKFVVDRSIPEKYHDAVKAGVLSWNPYFNEINLGEPFKVITCHDPEYPEVVDIFDTEAWYIMGTDINQYNGPYSGYSIYISDYRSGENLFGIISLNIIKIISAPSRYMYMSAITDDNEKDETNIRKTFDQYISKYIAWVTAHEVGHQIGLRHDFTGNLQKDGFGSVMDYIDVFTDIISMRSLDITGVNRFYDLKAIAYGYTPLAGEKTGVKHPQLKILAEKPSIPFGTDENYYEEINPLVGSMESDADVLKFVDRTMQDYHMYRQNLVKLVKRKKLSSYEYNTMFIYLYTEKYPELIHICLKYLGGRIYDNDRTHFVDVDGKTMIRATHLLLKLLREIEYSEDEYSYIIYGYKAKPNRQELNRINMDTLYSMNVRDLFFFYQSMVTQMYKGLIEEDRMVRLAQSQQKTYTLTDLLINFSFAYKTKSNKNVYDIFEIDGVFPEIGALLIRDSQWQSMLFDLTPLKYNRQYTWIVTLLNIYQKTTVHVIYECIHLILLNIKFSIHKYILPYLKTIDKKAKIEKFWKDPQTQIINHWGTLMSLLHTLTTKNPEPHLPPLVAPPESPSEGSLST